MRPDFFIAGAAKCGTTALFDYLSGHPSVFMPRTKEPKFFCTDIKTSGGVYSAEAYQALFAEAPEGVLTGEASALYLYSNIAIERIMAHNSAAKIIVMLRHPVEAAHSLHASRWGFGQENIASFEEAWGAQRDRLSGARLPRNWSDPATLQYGAMYRYASQILRVIEHVPARQRLFIVYEDFFRDPAKGFADVLEFLGLTPMAQMTFPIVNPSLSARSPRLDRWLRERPRWLAPLRAPLRPLVRALGIDPARTVRRLNAVPRPKAPLNPRFRAELERYFAADISEAEALLGRVLWSDSNSSSACGRTLETYRSQ